MLHKEIPFLRIGVPLCAGIIAYRYLDPDTPFLLLSSLLAAAGFVISIFFNRYQTNFVYGYPLTLALFISGIVLYSNEKDSISTLLPDLGTYLTTVSEYPTERGNNFRFTTRLEQKLNGPDKVCLNGSLLLYLRKDTGTVHFKPGDILLIRCVPVEISNRNNPDEFDYRFYMENRGVRYSAFLNRGDIIAHSSPDKRQLAHRALIIREKIIDLYRLRGITGDTLALVAALTLGQKNMLDPEQKQIFIKAGVMHIMAVSGLHAVILSLFLFNILFFLKKKLNPLRIVITILFLWTFAFVTGLTPSVLRATLMYSFLQTGKLMKRNVSSINSVLASAFVLILMRPSVIFDAGFLLSYSAVIFIICFYQDLYLKLSFSNLIADKIWQAAVVTIVAQAGTLPLTMSLFNRFPTYFLLTNVIIVPVSSLLVILGCIVPMTFPLVFISQPIASILGFLTGITESITLRASSLPFSSVENIGLTPTESLFLACTIFLLTWYMLRKPAFSVRYLLVMILIFIFLSTFKDISHKTSDELIVFNNSGNITLSIRTGKKLNLYEGEKDISPDILKFCATRGLKLIKKGKPKDPTCLKVNDNKILVSSSPGLTNLSKLDPDVIIITGAYPSTAKVISHPGKVKAIIISPEVRSGTRLTEITKPIASDTVHIVRQYGAFRMRL